MMGLSVAAIESLRQRLTTATIYTPEAEGYQESLVRWSDTGMKNAGVVVQPIDPADVQAAVLWAQEQSIDLAVKGGGHSTAGTSSSDGGLVIDLSRMNQVTVDSNERTITAQGGATWKEVDDIGALHGLVTVGGTVNHTGVGGLTLGAGYGWLSGQYGLTIDNLQSVTVVLADGSLVKASATEHSDLFWGLRGAGYNFGVALDFTYQAYEKKDPVYSGIMAFRPDQLEMVLQQLNGLLAEPDSRAGAMCVFAQAPDGSGPMMIVICFYDGTKDEGEARFAGFLSLNPVVNTVDMIPYALVNTLQNPQATYGDRKSFKGIFYEPPLNPQFVRNVFEEFMTKLQDEPDLNASAIILEFIDMRKICEVPLPSTAFASRNSTQNGIIYLRWTDPSKDLEHRAWAREVQAKWTAQLETSRQAKGHDNGTSSNTSRSDYVPQYINYAEPGDSVVPNIYGENLARLQTIKAKYDPTNVFNKMHPIRTNGSN